MLFLSLRPTLFLVQYCRARRFRTVLWEAPKDLMAAIEDVVVFLNCLQKCYRDLSQGATAQLLVMCNRTAVHNQLLQHGFQAAWFGGLRMPQPRQRRATARIAVVVQMGCGFLSGAVVVPLWKTGKTALGGPQWRLQEQCDTLTLSPPLTWLQDQLQKSGNRQQLCAH